MVKPIIIYTAMLKYYVPYIPIRRIWGFVITFFFFCFVFILNRSKISFIAL